MLIYSDWRSGVSVFLRHLSWVKFMPGGPHSSPEAVNPRKPRPVSDPPLLGSCQGYLCPFLEEVTTAHQDLETQPPLYHPLGPEHHPQRLFPHLHLALQILSLCCSSLPKFCLDFCLLGFVGCLFLFVCLFRDMVLGIPCWSQIYYLARGNFELLTLLRPPECHSYQCTWRYLILYGPGLPTCYANMLTYSPSCKFMFYSPLCIPDRHSVTIAGLDVEIT